MILTFLVGCAVAQFPQYEDLENKRNAIIEAHDKCREDCPYHKTLILDLCHRECHTVKWCDMCALVKNNAYKVEPRWQQKVAYWLMYDCRKANVLNCSGAGAGGATRDTPNGHSGIPGFSNKNGK